MTGTPNRPGTSESAAPRPGAQPHAHRSPEGSSATGPIGIGLAIGLASGALFGVVMGQLAFGLVVGIGMGIAMGIAFTMAAIPE